MSDNTVQEIELSIEQAKEFVERGKALERLRANPDFQAIVLKGYFENEAIRLVHLKSDPNVQGAEQQAAINKDIDAIGAFQWYLRVTQMQAQQAAVAIADGEEALDEIRHGEQA